MSGPARLRQLTDYWRLFFFQKNGFIYDHRSKSKRRFKMKKKDSTWKARGELAETMKTRSKRETEVCELWPSAGICLAQGVKSTRGEHGSEPLCPLSGSCFLVKPPVGHMCSFAGPQESEAEQLHSPRWVQGKLLPDVVRAQRGWGMCVDKP